MMSRAHVLPLVLIAGLALTGCADETPYYPPPCTSDADCGTATCRFAEGATSGYCVAPCGGLCPTGTVCGGPSGNECVPVGGGGSDACGGLTCAPFTCAASGDSCTTSCAQGCAAGFVCGDDNVSCVAAPTCADRECGRFLCDAATQACFTACTDGAQCADDSQCDDGACVEPPPLPYRFVAVVSTAQGANGLNNPNPGPDLDAISVSGAGGEAFATVVESSAMGAQGDTANVRSNFNGVLGSHDTLGNFPPNTCNLDIAQPGYTAIGGEGGFVVVSFGREIVTGDMVTVYEINEANCEMATTERPDTYAVYITHDADAARNNNASQISAPGSGWCLLGEQGGTGGTGTFTFNSDACAD